MKFVLTVWVLVVACWACGGTVPEEECEIVIVPETDPYSGTPMVVPGTIEAEDYDNGGENKAYHDTSVTNEGSGYRTSEGVGIESCSDTGGGYNVGWTEAGEWIRYTVDVALAGEYTIISRVAVGGSWAAFHIEVDGVDVTGSISVPATGGWQAWVNKTTSNVTLCKGEHVVEIAIETGGVNINYLKFMLDQVAASPPVLTDGQETNAASEQTVSITNLFPMQVSAYDVELVSDELSAQFDLLKNSGLSVSPELARQILIQSLKEGQSRSGVSALRAYLAAQSGSVSWNNPAAVDSMLSVAGCFRCLEAFRDADVSPEISNWLFGSLDRVRLIGETITESDNASEVFRIFEELYQHDPNGRERFFDLILAMAVVWDTPRLRMDDQIAEGWLPPDEDITVYYDYFKNLYLSPNAKITYDELSVEALIFVVDISAPVSELEWALENVDGTRGTWGRNYAEINYDHTRIDRNQYDWPHHEYTLQEIRECFGICVDQAYYCVITARARGIPCLYFHGLGKYGGHAWFGFMKRPTLWDLEVGRYSEQGYAIGYAIHPQTDHGMTDHELEYFTSRSLHPDKSRRASELAALARLLHEEGSPQSASVAAQKAAQLNPLCAVAWQTEHNVLVDADQINAAILQMEKNVDAVRIFPDEIVRIRKRQAQLLTRAGREKEAEAKLRVEVARAGGKRGDLQQKLVIAQAEHLLGQGRGDDGMQAIEEVLNEQRSNGFTVLYLLIEYKLFAERADFEKRAERFLERY